jgi:hypothetical protein
VVFAVSVVKTNCVDKQANVDQRPGADCDKQSCAIVAELFCDVEPRDSYEATEVSVRGWADGIAAHKEGENRKNEATRHFADA